MRIVLLLLILIGFSAQGEAQIRKHKKKRSTNAGTLFVDFGLNREGFFNSRLHLVGQDYDFTLKNVKGYDQLNKGYVGFDLSQFSGRIGYYFKNKWALAIGVNRFNYYMADQNDVLLNGRIESGVDTSWSGTYYDQPITTSRAQFDYCYSKGLYFIRIDLTRSFDLFEVGSKRQLALTGMAGISAGPVITSTQMLFAQQQTAKTTALSGYSLGINASLRLEFFKHFFIQAESMLGFAHVLNAHTRSNDRNQYARQTLGYYTGNFTVGALFYLRTKNGCDSCPHW